VLVSFASASAFSHPSTSSSQPTSHPMPSHCITLHCIASHYETLRRLGPPLFGGCTLINSFLRRCCEVHRVALYSKCRCFFAVVVVAGDRRMVGELTNSELCALINNVFLDQRLLDSQLLAILVPLTLPSPCLSDLLRTLGTELNPFGFLEVVVL
jgi:hypothetical protein